MIRLLINGCTVEVSPNPNQASPTLPAGMQAYPLQGGKYARFNNRGSASDVQDLIEAILNNWFPQSGYKLANRPHFQMFPAGYRQEGSRNTAHDLAAYRLFFVAGITYPTPQSLAPRTGQLCVSRSISLLRSCSDSCPHCSMPARTQINPPLGNALTRSSAPNRCTGATYHVHTGYSLDAWGYGTHATPADAYAFAKGAPIVLPDGTRVALDRPLDFMAVTDHAEWFNLLYMCTDPQWRSADYCKTMTEKNKPRPRDRGIWGIRYSNHHQSRPGAHPPM